MKLKKIFFFIYIVFCSYITFEEKEEKFNERHTNNWAVLVIIYDRFYNLI